MNDQTMQKIGTVKAWMPYGGYGFIVPDDTMSNDIFVHFREVEGYRMLKTGQRVAYDVGVDERSGRPTAKNVKPISVALT